MGFLNLLKVDFCVLRRCLTGHFTSGTRLVKSDSCGKTKILFRTITDDSKAMIPKPFANNRILIRLKQQDKIPKEFRLIYRAQRTLSFSALHCMLLVVSVSTPACLFVIASRNNFVFPIKFSDKLVLHNLFQASVLLTFIASLLISTSILVSRFPFRIYFNKMTDEYIAIYSNLLFPWKTTKVTFKKGQVDFIPEHQKWTFQLSNFKINGNKVILIEENFELPVDFENMINQKSIY